MKTAEISMELVVIILLILCGFMVGVQIGSIKELTNSRESAIEAGVAEWTIDPESGVRMFTWKEIENSSVDL